MDMKIFDEYGLIRLEIERLEAKRRELEPAIIQGMEELGKKSGQTKYGGLTIMERKKWDYTLETMKLESEIEESIKNKKAQLRDKQKEEQESGAATCAITKTVSFSPNKE